MFKKILFLILITTCVILAQNKHIPSRERANPDYRRQVNLEGNNIRTTVFNHGLTGREKGVPISEQVPFEWPKNTGQVYLAFISTMVGAEVIDEDGQKQNIIITPDYRSDPVTTNSWNFEPIPKYFNTARSTEEQTPANSLDPESWPATWPDKEDDEKDPGWPGSWNGFFGKDIFNADQEIFYRCGDDRYDKYNYFPDSTDLSRKGLSIIMDVRALAWSQVLVQDAVFILHTFKNDGTKDIDKFAVTLWDADFVGGDGDSQDDITEFDLKQDILWSRDADHKAPTFGSDPVGIVGVALLETPGNAEDRIDNDGDGEEGPEVTTALLVGEYLSQSGDTLRPPINQEPVDGIDNNHNGLVDENFSHVAFGGRSGVTYADYIDNDGDGEENSPLVTEEMVSHVQNDQWKRWPPNPQNDAIQNGKVHLIMVESDDVGKGFKDNIDNNDNAEEGSPVITQEMITSAAEDAPYYRYKIPGKNIILYDVKAEDLGKAYANGIDDDGDGIIDEDIDEGIDEMVDESRSDGIDNDGDWDITSDDVGLDGVLGTGDYGEGDGIPTSGAGTGFPGEPNVDLTDVSETDQIGISSTARIAAGGLNISSDRTMWFDFMIPGKLYDPFSVTSGEFDLFVTSAYFPLRAGQIEPISVAVILANGPATDPDGEIRKKNVLAKEIRAQETYDNDYQFANAPAIPTLTAIPGDGRVTLYWDDVAESSFDQYISNIGGNGYDFEGYRIYRASDPAIEDVKNITTAFGEKIFRTPLVQFDEIDNYQGLDSTGIDGANFYLGSNTGIRHSFVDSSVQNGFTYYYVLTSFDFGYPAGSILPTESPFRINVRGDGTVQMSKNVARVRPGPSAAGYVPPSLGNIELVQGTTTGRVSYDIVDPNLIRNNNVYKIIFEDTLIVGDVNKPDELKTKNYTLIDSTGSDTLIMRNPNFDPEYEQPLVHGFRLFFDNEEKVGLNPKKSGWSSDDIYAYAFQKFVTRTQKGEERTNDYKIIFGDVGVDRSTLVRVDNRDYPEQDVNFRIYNQTTKDFMQFGFIEVDTTGGAGKFTFNPANITRRDRIIFLEPNAAGTLVFTWWTFFNPNPADTAGRRFPASGDTLTIIISKPFLAADVFRFQAKSGHIDKREAKANLEEIKVVPNPYRGFAVFETKSIFESGRSPRQIQFINLPSECKIRIYTINGELVKVIEHNTDIKNGTASWDLLTKDNLEISYGIYIYHVEAQGIGEKVGKFAIIK